MSDKLVERVARAAAEDLRKLTKAQRTGVSRAYETSEGWCVGQSCREEECDELNAIGVTGKGGWHDILTPLGLAVRSILKEQQQ